MSDSSEFPPSELPLIEQTGSGNVPVFNCVVLVRPDEDQMRYQARIANLDGVTVAGPTERDVLLAATREFKKVVQEHLREGRSIPFLDPPSKPESDELERFIPVHL